MTNILAICSALNNSYLAFQINGNIYSKIIKSDENYHSLYLIKEIKNMCSEHNFSLENIDFITVNKGPGSFTGIRVSLTVAKILAQELNKPLVGLSTNEILLDAFNCDTLIMDARRDMYYLATKDNIELIYKDNMPQLTGKILTDKRSSSVAENSLCYEDNDLDLGKTMIKLAQLKYQTSKDKNEFNYLNINANYIQTPPISMS